jgi:UDP-N-acetylglucosamine 2-epimerase (non-hydrolysing)
MKKILVVIGTRPEAIKMAPLIKELRGMSDNFDVTICSTGQHRKMLDQVFSLFEITPDYDLDLMAPGQDLFDISSKVLVGIKKIIGLTNPDLILVHGDTTSAFTAALGGFYSRIPVGHIEAGLRSHNLSSPFPEELNRQMISKIAKWHFAPSDQAMKNIILENISQDNVFNTGNTVIDALRYTLDLINNDPVIQAEVRVALDEVLDFSWEKDQFVLITGHRRENFGKGFLEICAAIKSLAIEFPQFKFVYPVHLNPNVRSPIFKILSSLDNIYLIEPLEYRAFITLLKRCYFVLTDSGGIQEEAPFLGKPVLVMRDITEREEAIVAGTAILTGANAEQIVIAARDLIMSKENYLKMSNAHNPYGDGYASMKIANILGRVM